MLFKIYINVLRCIRSSIVHAVLCCSRRRLLAVRITLFLCLGTMRQIAPPLHSLLLMLSLWWRFGISTITITITSSCSVVSIVVGCTVAVARTCGCAGGMIIHDGRLTIGNGSWCGHSHAGRSELLLLLLRIVMVLLLLLLGSCHEWLLLHLIVLLLLMLLRRKGGSRCKWIRKSGHDRNRSSCCCWRCRSSSSSCSVLRMSGYIRAVAVAVGRGYLSSWWKLLLRLGSHGKRRKGGLLWMLLRHLLLLRHLRHHERLRHHEWIHSHLLVLIHHGLHASRRTATTPVPRASIGIHHHGNHHHDLKKEQTSERANEKSELV
jgi:hypothetical protein